MLDRTKQGTKELKTWQRGTQRSGSWRGELRQGKETLTKGNMTKYSEENKREERKIKALEKIGAALQKITEQLERLNENRIIG